MVNLAPTHVLKLLLSILKSKMVSFFHIFEYFGYSIILFFILVFINILIGITCYLFHLILIGFLCFDFRCHFRSGIINIRLLLSNLIIFLNSFFFGFRNLNLLLGFIFSTLWFLVLDLTLVFFLLFCLAILLVRKSKYETIELGNRQLKELLDMVINYASYTKLILQELVHHYLERIRTVEL